MKIKYQVNLNIICELKLLKLQILRRLEASSSRTQTFFSFGLGSEGHNQKEEEYSLNTNQMWMSTGLVRISGPLCIFLRKKKCSYFIRMEKRKNLTHYEEAKVGNILLALLMLCVILNNPWWHVNSFKSEELISPDLGKCAKILYQGMQIRQVNIINNWCSVVISMQEKKHRIV